MKVSISSILLALLLFAGSSSSQFTKYRAKDCISNATTFAQNNYSPYNLSAGVYEAEFDASNYSTGIYFYKLESKDFFPEYGK